MNQSTEMEHIRAVPELTPHTFDESVSGSPTPVVVDVWTEWCRPCNAIAPIIEELARDLDGTMQFYRLDAEAHPDLARRLDVMSFPTLLVFSDGRLVKRLIGARGRRHLLEELSHWM